MAEFIKARKGKFVKKFNADAWALLGKEKNGWEEITEESQVVDSIVKKSPPPSGDKAVPTSTGKQIVDNIATKVADKSQVVTDETKVEGAVKVDESKTDVADSTSPVLTSPEFKAVIVDEKITKATIKDFFDKHNEAEGAVKVVYKNTMNLDELIDLLAMHFANDIEKLKTEFKISDL